MKEYELKGIYEKIGEEYWKGRTDSKENYDAFRWHQVVEPLNLCENNLEPFDGKQGFCFIGFCCDIGVKNNKGRIGAANAPGKIRSAMASLPCWFNQDVKIFDAGNIICEDIALSKSQEILAKVVNKILKLNLFPIVLGGGHEVALGHYKGLESFLNENENDGNIGIINFDAHFDLRPYTEDRNSSGTMFREIADKCKVDGKKFSYMCLGIQKYSNTVELFKTAEELSVHYIMGQEMSRGDAWSVREKIDDFIKSNDHIYVTVCADVFSSAYAPGVSSPQPIGMKPENAINFLKFISNSEKVRCFDVAEVSPQFDQDNITANLARVLIFTVINGICRRKNLTWDDDI